MGNLELKTTVAIANLFLARDNPRHEEVDDEMEAIDLLCRTEEVETLAREIVRFGISPVERLILLPTDPNVGIADIDDKTTFIVAEGNRRVCALKLLRDPDKAPVKIREAIKALAEDWEPEKEIDSVVILDEERRRHWMRRIHDGVQGGRGRKPWNAEQKTRFSGTRRNVIAQQLFDYAAARALLRPEDRKGSFSHMARLVGNALLADALGLDSTGDDLLINRSTAEFKAVLVLVLAEAVSKDLGSQASKLKIDDFARRLVSGISTARVAPWPLEKGEPLKEPATTPKGPTSPENTGADTTAGSTAEPPTPPGTGPDQGPRDRPRLPASTDYVIHEPEIVAGLKDLGSHKLESLYYSICKLNAEHHTPLIAIGIWAFFECLTSLMGRAEGNAFDAYLSRGKLSTLAVGKGQSLNAPIEAIGNISKYGNITKHHGIAGQFDHRQMINDMKILKPLIVICLGEAK